MEPVEEIQMTAEREGALRQAPGRPVLLIRPTPMRARFAACHAIAYTLTHVLVEGDVDGDYFVRWEANWLVKRA
jgi:hypothetical protein